MESTFWTLAVVGTSVFVVRLVMMFVGFDHEHGGDLDMDGSIDVDDHVGHGGDSTSAFTFLSIQSVATFFMGTGWAGLVGLEAWDLDVFGASLFGVGFGLFCMFLLGKMLHMAMKLESSGNVDKRRAIGKVGRVYMRLPDQGAGQIQIEVQGRLMTLDARSTGGELATGASVRVDDVDGAGLLVVSPAK